MRDEGAADAAFISHYTDPLNGPDRHRAYTAHEEGFKAGADSTNDIIMKLVAVVEFYGDITDEMFVRDDGTKARQLLEELKGGVE